MGTYHDHHNPLDNLHDLGFLSGDRRGLIPRGLHGLHNLHNHRGYPQMPPMQNNYGPRRPDPQPIEPIQTEAQQMNPEQQSPSVIIDYDKKNPELPGKPTRDSVRALANWYRNNPMYGDVRVKISGTQIGNRELPPLGSQDMNFAEEDFKKWAFEVMGVGVIAEMPEPELPILRKIYGNLHVIEQMRLEKRQKDVTKGTITSLTKMELDNKMKDILADLRYGDPLEFKEDIDMLNTRIKDQKEYGYLGEEAIDYMFGCIISAHILRIPGSTMTMVDNQPVVETGDPVKDAQWKSTLATLHFGGKVGIPGVARDNHAKIADYIAAYTYHNVDKNLTGYYSTLQQKAIGTNPDTTLTDTVIKNSTLTNEEKTFLSLWVGQDVRLGDIQTRQRDYVERAKENMKGKSPETLERDMHRDTIGTLAKINPLLGAGIFVGVFGGLLAMIWGKDSKLAKFVLTIAAGLGLVGVATAAPGVLRDWQKSTFDNGNAITQAPRRTENTGDALTDAASEMPEFFRDKWNNVSAMFSTSNDWSALMLDERIGPKLVDKYPTGAILAVLNPDPDNEYNEKWRGTPTQEEEIKKILEKLDGDEKAKLNTMLTETWKKYIDANPAVTNVQLKTGTIQNMIKSLDTDYKWFNKVWRPAYYLNEESKEETLIEFTKNPTGWKNAKIGDLMFMWYKAGMTDSRADIRALGNRIPAANIQTLIAGIKPDRTASVREIITNIWEANSPGCDPEKTLGELLAKED